MIFIKLKIKDDKNPIDLHWRSVQMSQDNSKSQFKLYLKFKSKQTEETQSDFPSMYYFY